MRTVLIAVLLAALGCVARAQAPAESTLATARGLDSPTAVMARSLLVPGWGQAKNGQWVKAIVTAGIEGTLLERVFFEDRLARRYSRIAARYPLDDPGRVPWDRGVERHRAHRRDFIWWTSLFVMLSMGDAFVEAHLKHFDVRLQDQAPAGGDGGGGGAGVAVGLVVRW
jgi:hypothetical protein